MLDRRDNAAVHEVLTVWIQGHVKDDALNEVTDPLNTVPPGRPILEPN